MIRCRLILCRRTTKLSSITAPTVQSKSKTLIVMGSQRVIRREMDPQRAAHHAYLWGDFSRATLFGSEAVSAVNVSLQGRLAQRRNPLPNISYSTTAANSTLSNVLIMMSISKIPASPSMSSSSSASTNSPTFIANATATRQHFTR